MHDILANIEPCFFKKNEVIFAELDEFNCVVFIDSGTTGVGFEINKKTRFCLRYDNCAIYGAFGVTFRQRSKFVYKCFSKCTGQFIRAENWHNILESRP